VDTIETTTAGDVSVPVTDGLSSEATSTQIRGSSLLLLGRIIATAVNVLIQVVIVRYLSKEQFGAFAYALSLVTLGEAIVTAGLDRAITRFLPIYDEEGKPGKMLGTLVLVGGTILSLGLAVIVITLGLRALSGGSLLGDAQAVALLSIMIVLAPLQAIDTVATGVFAVFSKPTAIFFRKYLLEPGLKLMAVAALVWSHSTPRALAAGYVAAGVVGTLFYVWVLFRMLSRSGVLRRFRETRMEIPVREVLSFTIPLLTSDLLYSVMTTSDAIMLARWRGAEEVAAFRVVQPAARLNQLVLTSFALLFTAVAARMFARRSKKELGHLYWQTAVWMAVLAFPMFAVTFALARPVTETMYGIRYADSAIMMSLLSFGYYFNVVLGFNGLMLKVVGKLRAVVAINAIALVVNLALNVVLIRAYGALGAAIGTAATLVVHNLLKQGALGLATGVSLFEPRLRGLYATIVMTAAALILLQYALDPPLLVGLVAAGLGSLLVLAVGRRSLAVGETFPELMRYRIVRMMVGGREK
jgi:O-antigen/teichoic acid export membrane protein